MSFLFVDRILELSPGEKVRGVKHVTMDDQYLSRDPGGKLCFIPSLVGEALGQLAAWNVMVHNQFRSRPVAGIVAAARLLRPVYLGETLLLESFIDSLDESAVQYHSFAHVGEELVFSIDGALGPLLPMEDFIDVETVRCQFAMINRPLEKLADFSGELSGKIVPEMPSLAGTVSPMVFDRLLSSESGKSLVAEKKVTRSAPYFADHFPRKPVLPLTVLLECKLNLAYELLRGANWHQRYQISELRKIKMSDFVHPGDIVICQLTVKEQSPEHCILSFRSEVADRRVCGLEMIMVAKEN